MTIIPLYSSQSCHSKYNFVRVRDAESFMLAIYDLFFKAQILSAVRFNLIAPKQKDRIMIIFDGIASLSYYSMAMGRRFSPCL